MVYDEFRAGNLAIDGAKNFGRFEEFFLPGAKWEMIRGDIQSRAGLPDNLVLAVNHL